MSYKKLQIQLSNIINLQKKKLFFQCISSVKFFKDKPIFAPGETFPFLSLLSASSQPSVLILTCFSLTFRIPVGKKSQQINQPLKGQKNLPVKLVSQVYD